MPARIAERACGFLRSTAKSAARILKNTGGTYAGRREIYPIGAFSGCYGRKTGELELGP